VRKKAQREISCASRLWPVLLGAAIFALVAPPAGASASGAIAGEITGPGGTPIAEVWACAYLVSSEEFEENCDEAGAGGAYSIPALKAGEYKVEFWSEAVAPSYAGEFYDDKLTWEEADEIDVMDGTVTSGIDAELAEAATIEGQVSASSLGGPVEEALVCAQRPTGAFTGCVPNRPDGSYTLPGLPAGSYKVQFIPAAFTYNLLNQFYEHKSEFAEADTLALAAGETRTGVDADLEAGAEIHGTVYSATTGAPVPEVVVCAFAPFGGEGDWVFRECVPTSATGSYALNALTTDPYKVAFSLEFKEFFGEEEFEGEDDGYVTQYFDHKLTLAAADVLPLVAPEVRTGVDGHIQPKFSPTTPGQLAAPQVLFRPAPSRKSRRKHCRPGFRKKKVAGKRRCVKVHKRRHGRKRGPAAKASTAGRLTERPAAAYR